MCQALPCMLPCLWPRAHTRCESFVWTLPMSRPHRVTDLVEEVSGPDAAKRKPGDGGATDAPDDAKPPRKLPSSVALRLNNNFLSEVTSLESVLPLVVRNPADICWIDLSFNQLERIDRVRLGVAVLLCGRDVALSCVRWQWARAACHCVTRMPGCRHAPAVAVCGCTAKRDHVAVPVVGPPSSCRCSAIMSADAALW